MDGKIDTVREALERGLDKERQKKYSDAMECMTTHRWYWQWAQDLESNCKEALAALSAIDPEEIRRECADRAESWFYSTISSEASIELERHLIDLRFRQISTLRAAILSAETAQDDVKPEVGDIVAWDKEGLNVEAYKHPRREIVRRPVVLMRFAEVKRRIEEAKE